MASRERLNLMGQPGTGQTLLEKRRKNAGKLADSSPHDEKVRLPSKEEIQEESPNKFNNCRHFASFAILAMK